jgi:hypothetical protein
MYQDLQLWCARRDYLTRLFATLSNPVRELVNSPTGLLPSRSHTHMLVAIPASWIGQVSKKDPDSAMYQDLQLWCARRDSNPEPSDP